MKLFVTYLVIVAIVALLGLFTWGWFLGKEVPESVYAGLLGLIGTLIGYLWLRDARKGGEAAGSERAGASEPEPDFDRNERMAARTPDQP